MANVVFRRGTSAELAQISNIDGQLLFSTDENKILMDDGTTRKQYGGDTEVDDALSSTSENPLQNKIVYSSCVKYTDIVDSLSTISTITANDIPVGALAVKELNSNLTANSQPFRFGYENGTYGYILPDGEGGADTLHPFSSCKLLWTNPNPLAPSFPGQKVSIDLTGYSGVLISVIYAYNYPNNHKTYQYIPRNAVLGVHEATNPLAMELINGAYGGSASNVTRTLLIDNDGITFGDCSSSNGANVPYQIWGMRNLPDTPWSL